MKKIFSIVLLIILSLPIIISALSENEARKVIVDYANYVYNNKKNEISYLSPAKVQQERIFLGYKTDSQNGKSTYGMDCNAFVGFMVYNALQLNANKDGYLGNGLMSGGRIALNGPDGWSSHSSFYGNGTRFELRSGETLADATKRYDIKSKLKAGDAIGVIGYKNTFYPVYDNGKDCDVDKNQAKCEKCSHIMLYIGNRQYIHNASGGVTLTTLPTMSHGLCKGADFGGKTHGSITVLRFKDFDQIDPNAAKSYRFPNGNGSLVTVNKTTSNNNGDDDNDSDVVIPGIRVTSDSKVRVCQRADVAKVIKISVLAIKIIFAIVPILLILSLMIGLVKVVGNANELEKFKKTAVSKIVAAVLIFIVPMAVNLVIGISSPNNLLKECLDLADSPINVTDYVRKTSSSTPATPTSQGIEIKKDGIYIQLSFKGAEGYYFSKTQKSLKGDETGWIKSTKNDLDFILLPGDHYIYAKNKAGEIHEKKVTVSTSDIVDTNEAKDIKFPNERLDNFLKSKGSSIDEFNNSLFRSVTIAGLNTREGTAAASLALTQILYKKYKVKIPYGGSPYMKAGARETWGSGNMGEIGTHCGGFVVWALAQSGMGTNSGIGSSAQFTNWRYSSIKRITDNYHGTPGEAITGAVDVGESKHVALVSAMDDKGFWITESNAWTEKDENGQIKIKENYGIVTTYNAFSKYRWRSILPLEAVYENKRFDNIDIGTGF